MWEISIVLSISILVVTILFLLLTSRHTRKRVINNPLTVFLGGMFLASVCMFFPICHMDCVSNIRSIFVSILEAVHSSIKLFVVDSDFGMVRDSVSHLNEGLKGVYEIWGALLITLSPVLTFGVVLSFFKNAMSYQQFLLHFFTDTYIFSELNEKSIALAESIRKANEKCLLIFMDVFESDEEKSYELIGRATGLGALCFKKDVVTIDFRIHSSKSQIYFMIIGEDETENISQTLRLAEKYYECANVRIDTFAKSTEAEILLRTADKGKIKMIRRLNDVQSLVSRILYETGEKIFTYTKNENDEKIISAFIVGMGQHGFEMAKALVWFCQMIGYRFEMNIVDKDVNAKDIFEMQCPDLLSKKYNGTYIDGEPQYKISVHSGIDVNTNSFRKLLEEIGCPTYVFVCLGSDRQNVKTAIDIRSFYATNEFPPRIQAVMYSSSEKEALYHVKYNDSSRTRAYEIEFVGDIKTSYSREVILNSEVERKALERHLMWGNEESFWAYEYNYRSSIASAIHQKMKILCRIPYADAKPEERPWKERDMLRKLEHCRWSAYVRSEGYTYGEERNDLAKKHPCLVPYDQLSEEEKAKDDV